MKYFLLLITIFGMQTLAQSNQDFDLKLVKGTSSSIDGVMDLDKICQVSSKNVTESCLPVAVMNNIDLGSKPVFLSETFQPVGHMDLISLAKDLQEIYTTKENPEEYIVKNDSTPMLLAVMSLDQDQLASAVEKFDVLSIRRVAAPFSYLELLEMKTDEAKKNYSQYIDQSNQVFNIPVYFNVYWKSGISQGTIQVVSMISMPLSDGGNSDNDLTVEDQFRPDVMKFSDTKTEANLGRGIERALRARAMTGVSITKYALNGVTYNAQADDETMKLLNNVVAPYVGNYLYAAPIQKAVAYLIAQALTKKAEAGVNVTPK